METVEDVDIIFSQQFVDYGLRQRQSGSRFYVGNNHWDVKEVLLGALSH